MGADCNKIGIFDSGFGGLTIFRAIQKSLPQYEYIYLGDNARTPYGQRSFETVTRFTTEGVDYLLRQGCRLVIVACNTASARALRNIQQKWLPQQSQGLRVLGVIRPTVETLSGLGTVGLWATPGTVDSGSFVIEAGKHAPGTELVQNACPLLAPLIEAGELSGAGVEHFVSKYWQETVKKVVKNGRKPEDLKTLLLACTHYPLLLPVIRKIVPASVKILSQEDIVAHSLTDYLQRHPEIESSLSKPAQPSTRYLTTDRCEFFDRLAEVFLGQAVTSEWVQISE